MRFKYYAFLALRSAFEHAGVPNNLMLLKQWNSLVCSSMVTYFQSKGAAFSKYTLLLISYSFCTCVSATLFAGLFGQTLDLPDLSLQVAIWTRLWPLPSVCWGGSRGARCRCTSWRRRWVPSWGLGSSLECTSVSGHPPKYKWQIAVFGKVIK